MFVGVCVCISLSAGLGVMLPTDQQFWEHRSCLAPREEDEARKCVCVGKGELVFDKWEWEEFPRLRVCVRVFVRGLQHAPTLRDDSSVLLCSACSCGYFGVGEVWRNSFGCPWGGFCRGTPHILLHIHLLTIHNYTAAQKPKMQHYKYKAFKHKQAEPITDTSVHKTHCRSYKYTKNATVCTSS